MRRRTIVIISMLFLMIFLSILLLPKFYAAFNQVGDLTVQVSEETIQQGENLTVTVQDQSETDTKVTLPLPNGLTYQNTYNGNASVTYDAANQQIVIDWMEGQAKQVQLTLLAETSGTYSLRASTIREDNPVESAPASLEVAAIESDTEVEDDTASNAADEAAAPDEEEGATEQTEPETSSDPSATDKKEDALQADNSQLQETSKTFNDWFPDDALAKCVAKRLDKQPTDTVTDTQLATITYFSCFKSGVLDMTGLEYLTGLTRLNCSANVLKELDVSHSPNLTDLDCSSNALKELDVSHNPNLTDLDCSSNDLKELDVSHNPNLTNLDCSHNNLTNLDVSHNPNVTGLDCSANILSELDVSQNPNLDYLLCFSNRLSELDVSHNPELTGLDCRFNRMTELNVSHNPNLTRLACSSNALKELDVSHNPNLKDLDCSYNTLKELDVSQNQSLASLNCFGNRLSELDVSQNQSLTSLNCFGNALKELDVSQNQSLTSLDCSANVLKELDMSHNPNLTSLDCALNSLSELDLSQNLKLTSLDCSENDFLDFSFVPEHIKNLDATRQGFYLPSQFLTSNTLTVAVENLKDEKGNKITNITPENGGVYNSLDNTITWTNLSVTRGRLTSVSYDFISTSGKCSGTIHIPYSLITLSCDDEITYVQGTTKSAGDFLTDIHATTDSDTDNVVTSDFDAVVDMDQPGDYTVNVTANNPHFELETTKEVTVHIIPYTLQFNSAPTDITFETSAVEKGQKIIQREETEPYSFSVEDTRAADAHWSVTASIEAPLKNAEGDTLDNALVYKKNGQETILTPGNAVEITNSEEQTKEDAEFDISWQEEEGLLLDVDTNAVRSTTYQTTLYWELRNTP